PGGLDEFLVDVVELAVGAADVHQGQDPEEDELEQAREDAEGQVAALEQSLADELGCEGHEQHETIEDDQDDRRQNAREAGALGYKLRKTRVAPDVRVHRARHFHSLPRISNTNRFASTFLLPYWPSDAASR